VWASHFVKSGRFGPDSARTLARLQRYRELTDYSGDFAVDEAAAREDVDAASSLLSRIRDEFDG
jgi:hypothetical protein